MLPIKVLPEYFQDGIVNLKYNIDRSHRKSWQIYVKNTCIYWYDGHFGKLVSLQQLKLESEFHTFGLMPHLRLENQYTDMMGKDSVAAVIIAITFVHVNIMLFPTYPLIYYWRDFKWCLFYTTVLILLSH